ncbi:MAG: alpha/beta hydrolase [Alphaproteobacteria bacterium]|nr:MAG: alpha/beta hydrolase [Alphaproteobacteria bacterium]
MIRKLMGLVAAISLMAGVAAHAAPPEDISGDWFGTLKTPGGNLTLILTLHRDESGLHAVLESPDQAPGQKIPVATASLDGDVLSFEARIIGARYTGTWTGDRWQGTFNQGMDLPLDFARGERMAKPVVTGLDGVWNGTISRGGQDIATVLKVKTGPDGTNATFDVPGQMAFGLPVTDLSHDAGKIHFAITAVQATYDGTLDADGKGMTGTWTRAGNEPLAVSFAFAGDKAAERRRPQTPKAPFPYKAEDVAFENAAAGGIKLAGTLTLPEGAGPFPAAILLTGSGPQDRDETLFDHKPFAVIADSLTRSGIAVLRYDDRGFGKSGGSFAGATSADFATDANAAFAYLAGRADIDPNAIGMIGHSEGGMVAPIAARANDRIAFMVLLAGPGTTTRQLLESQRRLIARTQGVPEAEIDRTQAALGAALDAVASAKDGAEAAQALDRILTDERLATLGIPAGQKAVAIAQYSNDWFRYFLKYNPADWVPGLKMPVLAIGGSLDIQVPATENLPALEKLLAQNPDATVVELKGLNHLFQHARTGALDEYVTIEETFAPEALNQMADWIGQRF